MARQGADSLIPSAIGIGSLLLVAGVILGCILSLNSGMLVYTLDDPYIHMAVAENILLGHYGINLDEYSAPSSSVIWPFILAPFSAMEWFPFILNTVVAAATVLLFSKALRLSLKLGNSAGEIAFESTLLMVLVFATNLVGLIFTGMEHSLQVLTVAAIAYGIFVEAETNRVEPWLLFALVAAPLVRYESAAVTLAGLAYLCYRGYYFRAASCLALLLLCLSTFSVFLMALDLGAFPTSIVVKSGVVEAGGTIPSVVDNIQRTLFSRPGIFLSIGALSLFSYALLGSVAKRRLLASVSFCAVGMHIVAGKYGWYNRYEIYILVYFLMTGFYIFGPAITKRIRQDKEEVNIFKAIALSLVCGSVFAATYVNDLFTIPLASNNIYEQQYQMHRFVVDYYKRPVAVNDLGYVAYKNNNYVLDLWGLGSKQALDLRAASNDGIWMRELAEDRNVGLVMIYDDWFKQQPPEWVRIGELQLGHKRITPAESKVAFYATSREAVAEIQRNLSKFAESLPDGVRFVTQ